jgi:hypothetical protein
MGQIVVHYRRRCNLRSCWSCSISSPRLSSNNSMAYIGGENSCSGSDRPRYCWSCTQRRCSCRPQASCSRSAALPILFHPEYASLSMLLQQLLPYRRWLSRILQNHHTRPHVPTIPGLRFRWLLCWTQLRQVQRAHDPHHGLHGCSSGWLHHLLHHAQYTGTIHFLLPVCLRGICRQLCHSGLGVSIHGPNDGKEGYFPFDCQRDCQRVIHLYALSVPQD